MNPTQKRFLQIALLLFAILLAGASWKRLPPDTFWLPYSYRVVFDRSDGRQWGLESRFHNMGTSILAGVIAPIVCLGGALFLQLGKSSGR
jgi:hypothetical protein